MNFGGGWCFWLYDTTSAAKGFEDINLHRIERFVEHGNTKIKRALAKSNFIYEETMHHYEKKNGQFIGIEIYAILRT